MPCLRYPAVALICACLLAWAGGAAAFGFDELTARAQALSQQPPREPQRAPKEVQALTYDQVRDIRFRPERALWRDAALPFEAMFFHAGHVQADLVQLHEIAPDGTLRTLAYDASSFDYGGNAAAAGRWAALGPLGFAGVRLHAALNSDRYKDELIVFQGASYFRALGAGQRYGLSARGLAIDTVGAGAEEFPRFTEFWLQRPAAGARQVVVLALLESARATGAYRFDITPGAQTVTEVRARVFLRPGVAAPTALGIAPLTSMFFSGENQPRPGDFRPEVHDSDGLLIAAADGEWIWRPLQNPAAPLVSSFALRAPKGFGLMQRDRRFASYEDTEARYELRPSAWVEPLGDWGAGRVELLQLPAPDETHDNIVAYWVPATLPAPGQALDIAYRLHWQGPVSGEQKTRPDPGASTGASPASSGGAWVSQTRSGRGHAALQPDEQQFIVDFAGVPVGADGLRALASADANGEITELNSYRNEATGAWRMSLRVRRRDPARALELRAFLQDGSDTASETWSHLIPPR